MSFSDFKLNPDFINSIHSAGYESPTEFQNQLIPVIQSQKSALVWGQSTAGKTGAFLIPAMNYILQNPAPEKRGARILILTSRRDRVSQINHTIKRLSVDLPMRFGFIVSGRPYQTQMRLMRRPLDIMIATPGRLNDLMDNGKADFSQLEMLIIDDLSSIYRKNLQGLVENILKQTEGQCLSVTFVSADDDAAPYAESVFEGAEQITIENEGEDLLPSELPPSDSAPEKAPKATPKQKPKKEIQFNSDELIPQRVHLADDYTHKIAMLDHLMDEFAGEPTIIYIATNKAAKNLQDNLANHGHAADLIDKLTEAEMLESDILIYSDQVNTQIAKALMAKIDSNIINFDLPNNLKNYFTRLGRHQPDREKPTLLLLDGFNFNELKSLEKLIGEKIEQKTIPGLEPLKPFVNLSKNSSNKGKGNQTNGQTKSNKQSRNKRPSGNKSQIAKRNGKQKNNTRNRKNQNNEQNQRRQHKGAFGRLNSGTQRKTNHKKIGVSRVGTGAPKDGRGWQSDFVEPKERSTDTNKKVTIRYNKKRTLSIKKPEET